MTDATVRDELASLSSEIRATRALLLQHISMTSSSLKDAQLRAEAIMSLLQRIMVNLP